MTNPKQWAPTSPWVIDSPSQEVELDEKGIGETTFTLTNSGSTQNRVMFEIVPGDGASEEWFTVLEPQRLVSAAGSVIYQVKVRVPPNSAAGSYEFTGRAYTADGPAPEENSSTSNRVKLQVRPTTKPKRKLNPLLLVAAGVVVLLVLGVTAFFLFRGGDDDGGEIILANQSLVVQGNNIADLDTGTIVRNGGSLQFRNFGVADQFLQPLNGAKIAALGVVADPDLQACLDADVRDVLIPARLVVAGSVLCVQTPQQRMAVITVIQSANQQLTIRYDLFRLNSAG